MRGRRGRAALAALIAALVLVSGVAAADAAPTRPGAPAAAPANDPVIVVNGLFGVGPARPGSTSSATRRAGSSRAPTSSTRAGPPRSTA